MDGGARGRASRNPPPSATPSAPQVPIFGEAPSVERALDLYAQAGARGSADALYALGVLRYVGHGPDCPRPRGNQIFNPTSIEWFGPASSAVLRALNESERFVQKSAESSSRVLKFGITQLTD